MHTETPDQILQTAIAAIGAGSANLVRTLNGLPAAIYVTDADGLVTHYNRHCIDFAGRTPRIG